MSCFPVQNKSIIYKNPCDSHTEGLSHVILLWSATFGEAFIVMQTQQIILFNLKVRCYLINPSEVGGVTSARWALSASAQKSTSSESHSAALALFLCSYFPGGRWVDAMRKACSRLWGNRLVMALPAGVGCTVQLPAKVFWFRGEFLFVNFGSERFLFFFFAFGSWVFCTRTQQVTSKTGKGFLQIYSQINTLRRRVVLKIATV